MKAGRKRGTTRRRALKASVAALVTVGSLALATPSAFAMSVMTRRPAARPRGATAQCRDGSYSFTPVRKAACWRHRGVRIWYR